MVDDLDRGQAQETSLVVAELNHWAHEFCANKLRCGTAWAVFGLFCVEVVGQYWGCQTNVHRLMSLVLGFFR